MLGFFLGKELMPVAKNQLSQNWGGRRGCAVRAVARYSLLVAVLLCKIADLQQYPPLSGIMTVH